MHEQLGNFLFNNISASPPTPPLGKSVQKIRNSSATPATLMITYDLDVEGAP